MSDARLDELDRRGFIADPDVLASLGMGVDDLGDPDARAFVIRHEHPEFKEALDAGLGEIDLGNGPVNPRLHLVMHEVVATQLWDGDPPEVWETAVRLRDTGHERHEILHMLGRPVSDQIWAAWHDNQPHDRARHVAALRALPGTWDRDRSVSAAEKPDATRKQARRSARAARRRNRRPK